MPITFSQDHNLIQKVTNLAFIGLGCFAFEILVIRLVELIGTQIWEYFFFRLFINLLVWGYIVIPALIAYQSSNKTIKVLALIVGSLLLLERITTFIINEMPEEDPLLFFQF